VWFTVYSLGYWVWDLDFRIYFELGLKCILWGIECGCVV
jgi:hypothetical protein